MGESQQQCSGSGASIIVQEVMEEEWSALQSEDRRLPSLWGPEGMAEVGLPHSVFFSLYLFPGQSLGLFLCQPCQVYGPRES